MYAKMAGDKRLIPFAELNMLDHFVQYYSGAYTHETAALLGLEFAYSLRLAAKEVTDFHDRLHKVRQQLNQKK